MRAFIKKVVSERPDPRLAAYIAFCICALFVFLAVAPLSFDLISPALRHKRASVLASWDEDTGELFFEGGYAEIKTSLSIDYKTRLSAGEPADFQVTVAQTHIHHLGGMKRERVLSAFEYAVEISLTIDGKSNLRTIPHESPAPAHLIWAPSLSSDAKQAIAIVSAKTVRGSVSLTINGETQLLHEPRDIRLPIEIYRYGMPAWLWEYVSLGGTILSFILGCAFFYGAVLSTFELAF
jgi:hypothetical protein